MNLSTEVKLNSSNVLKIKTHQFVEKMFSLGKSQKKVHPLVAGPPRGGGGGKGGPIKKKKIFF